MFNVSAPHFTRFHGFLFILILLLVVKSLYYEILCFGASFGQNTLVNEIFNFNEFLLVGKLKEIIITRMCK